MPTATRKRLFLDQLGPRFNAVEGTNFSEGNFGPGALGDTNIQIGRQIRYSILDFKRMLKKFLLEYITNLEGVWPGPLAGQASVWESADYAGTNQHQENFTTRAAYDHFNLGGVKAISNPTGNVFAEGNFFDPGNPIPGGACPLIDPENPEGEREPAELTEFANGSVDFGFTLMSPAIEQASWREATHVWLPFNWQAFGIHNYSYICDPSGVSGTVSGGPFLDHNILGVGYTAGGGAEFPIPPTGSFLLGDGTTSLYVWSPTGNRFTLDSLDTRVGLDP